MCELDFDDRPDHLDVRHRTARKEHRCSACRGTVKPGDRYAITTMIYGGDVDVEKACPTCAAAMEEFGRAHRATVMPSSFGEFLDECVVGDDEGAKWKPMLDALRARQTAAREARR